MEEKEYTKYGSPLTDLRVKSFELALRFNPETSEKAKAIADDLYNYFMENYKMPNERAEEWL